jgi:hypothetical protein
MQKAHLHCSGHDRGMVPGEMDDRWHWLPLYHDSEESKTLRGLGLVACALILHRRPAPKRRNLDLTIRNSRLSFSERPAAIQAKKYHRIREPVPQSRGMVKLFIDAYSK